jgi:putative transposase
LDNSTIASSDGSYRRFDTSSITETKEKYSKVKSHLVRDDHRIRKEVYSKYGKLQSNKENQTLHAISKEIVNKAEEMNFGIVMENIKGIRRLYRKGNGQGNRYRRRLNSWSFYKLQKMIEYKAKWKGIRVIYVPPHKTSSSCATCGLRVTECAGRMVYCQKCVTAVDRDINAARNILARGLRFGPIGPPSEAVTGNPMKEPMAEVILGVDGGQSRLLSTSIT